MSVETITAAALRIGDELLDGHAVRHVTFVQLQGAQPEACVELAGISGWRHYRASLRNGSPAATHPHDADDTGG